MGTRSQMSNLNESYRTIKRLVDTCHRSHWDSMLLSCKTGTPLKFFPEIDFNNSADVAFLESYIALKKNPKAQEVVCE